ncbi:hypothetical protein ymoll0001_20080 [Yersinia mollaretii ATCC 43969]|uniref:Uncharacterized protein n=2 Tax=Yersinia mollaretii TaxID=33060 RepID=A0ABP2EJA4_YERMW|nr:hypothetical protein ymoll0001_20080 [Yersinia mollaretii ATCC 43969]
MHSICYFECDVIRRLIMDAKNSGIEKNSLNLRRIFSNFFDWDDMDVTYGKVDLINKSIFTMPSSYEWFLIYYDDDLDLLTSQRIVPGIQYWSNYSSKHTDTLLKNSKRESKVDICTQYENVFELLSINSRRNLSFTDVMTLYKWKPIIAHYAERVWSQNQDVILPLREDIPLYEDSADNSSAVSVDSHPYIRFGNIQFTRKEIITIRLLLSDLKIEDISAIQRCSLTSEYARIQQIKEKLNCEQHSSVGLVNAFKDHGITLSSLDLFTVYP